MPASPEPRPVHSCLLLLCCTHTPVSVPTLRHTHYHNVRILIPLGLTTEQRAMSNDIQKADQIAYRLFTKLTLVVNQARSTAESATTGAATNRPQPRVDKWVRLHSLTRRFIYSFIGAAVQPRNARLGYIQRPSPHLPLRLLHLPSPCPTPLRTPSPLIHPGANE